jgi:hypothetical protein
VAYINPPIETDPSALFDLAAAEMAGRVPGWEPSPASRLDVIVLAVSSILIAEARDAASAVPRLIFRSLGADLFGIPPIPEARASMTVTFSFTDAAGYTVPAGTHVGVQDATGEIVAFVTQSDAVGAVGLTTSDPVTALAVAPGSSYNGLSTVSLRLLDVVGYVDAVSAVETETAGGVDAEEEDAYLDRLAAEMRLTAPRPILPQDFATMAKRTPGIVRALPLDLYNPNTDTWNNERTITLVVLGPDGQDAGAAAKAAAEADLSERRETGFQVFVRDPVRDVVTVAYTATAYPGYDPADVTLRADAALAGALDPATWGSRAGLLVVGDDPADANTDEWLYQPEIRYFDLITVLRNVPGVWTVDTLTINGTTGDVALSSPLAVPDASVGGTVT